MEDKQTKLIAALNEVLNIFKKHELTHDEAVHVSRAASELSWNVIPYEYPQGGQAETTGSRTILEQS